MHSTWFVVYVVDPGVFAITEPYQFQEVISYLILGTDRGLLFDTGLGIGNIRKVVDQLTDLDVVVLNSHTHYDHIGDLPPVIGDYAPRAAILVNHSGRVMLERCPQLLGCGSIGGRPREPSRFEVEGAEELGPLVMIAGTGFAEHEGQARNRLLIVAGLLDLRFRKASDDVTVLEYRDTVHRHVGDRPLDAAHMDSGAPGAERRHGLEQKVVGVGKEKIPEQIGRAHV